VTESLFSPRSQFFFHPPHNLLRPLPQGRSLSVFFLSLSSPFLTHSYFDNRGSPPEGLLPRLQLCYERAVRASPSTKKMKTDARTVTSQTCRPRPSSLHMLAPPCPPTCCLHGLNVADLERGQPFVVVRGEETAVRCYIDQGERRPLSRLGACELHREVPREPREGVPRQACEVHREVHGGGHQPVHIRK